MEFRKLKKRNNKIEELEKELKEERKVYQERIRELEDENKRLIIAYENLEQIIKNPREFAEYLIKKLGIRGAMEYVHNLLNELHNERDRYVRERISVIGEENYIREVARYKFGNIETRIITSEEGLGLPSEEIKEHVKMERENNKIKITIYWLSGYKDNSTGLYVYYVYPPRFFDHLVSKRIEDALRKALSSEGLYVKNPNIHLKVFSIQQISEKELEKILERFVKNLILLNS